DVFRDRDPFAVLAARTRLVDDWVAAKSAELLSPRFATPFAMAAVGGYGRRELFPCSDVDLLLVVSSEADIANVKEPLSDFLRELWDSGLRVSHSVRTVEECCRLNEQNIELHVSLLDLRFLCGERELFDRTERALGEFYAHQGRRIAARLAELARQRHRKSDDTPYHLEPNIKETCGGIRDLHLLGWFSQIYRNRPEIGETLGGLREARRFLFALRCFLHFESRRDNNLLSFERQDEAARRLPSEPVSPEGWMRQYFQHARHVFGSALRPLEIPEAEQSSLWRQVRDRQSRISTAEITVSRNRVLLRNPATTLRSAEGALGVFAFVGRHGTPLSWDAQRRVSGEAGRIRKLFFEAPPRWRSWHDFFSQPHCALALGAMQEADALTAAVPEWKQIESLVVRDFYHRYTVDEHTLRAIHAVDTLARRAAEAPERFRHLASEEDDPALLRMALLLHDLGKGTRPGDHVRGSLEAARAVLDRMGAPEPARAAVLFLIEHHLDLSQTMSSRDLDDPATARFLTSRIGTQEDLRRLALLTYADISAVNPTAMTPWRSAQLWRVYSTALRQFTRELASDRIHDAEQAALPADIARFLEGFPMRYLRTHTRKEIERHFALYGKSLRDGAALEIRRDPHAWLMTVLAHDQPRLFASLCGTLASFGMNIVKAEAFSNTSACVLDSIRFTDPLHTLELNPSEVNRLEWTVGCVLKQTIAVDDLLKRRRTTPRPARAAEIAPSARFYRDASDTATLIEFVGEDRPGLLHDLASAISSAGCNIEVVMIDTEAHKAVDVFYVTRDGQKPDEATEDRLRAELTAAAGKSRS
ncbi:MAG: ACT domain-containing protein, partial [Bryobacteraceae bacterium]